MRRISAVPLLALASMVTGLSCGKIYGPPRAAVVRLEAPAGGAAAAGDEEQTVAVLRTRLMRRHAWLIRFDRQPGQPPRYRVSFRGGPSEEAMRVALSDHRLEFRALADSRDWPDESAARADLGDSPPPGALLLPDAGRLSGEAHAYLVSEKNVLNGCDLERIDAGADAMGRPQLSARFTPAAADTFRAYTRAHGGGRLAVLYDGQVVMAPVIQGEMGADIQIVGGFSREEAADIANILSAGCAPLRPVIEKIDAMQR